MPQATSARRAAGGRPRCAVCGAAIKRGDRFCGACGQPTQANVATAIPPPQTGAGASLQVSVDRQADLRDMRRLVTVVFADLSGSTSLAERLDPEDLRSILSAYFGVIARQVQQYGGTIDKYIGDAIMAVFGAPVAHEDDAERAISAALNMQQSVTHLNADLVHRYGIELALRIGINTGEVVAGVIADAAQTSYTVVGDTVNTAQRFEAAAPAGGILVSATTRHLTAHAFAFEALAPLTMKGKAEPQPAFRVLRRHVEDVHLATLPLIGRDAELERLSELVRAGLGGGRGLILLTGEAGMGKTRLLASVPSALPKTVELIRVRCASFEDQTPYALVGRLLRGILQIPPGADASMAEAVIVASFEVAGKDLEPSTIAVLLDVLRFGERTAFDPEITRRVVQSVLDSLIRTACARAPLVLGAEDLQWADEASLSLLDTLAAGIGELPCVLIASARPGWVSPWPVDTLALERLDDDSARALVQLAFGEPTDPAVSEAILQRTNGNPLFIEEIVRDLRARGALTRLNGRLAIKDDVAARVPDTLQELLVARLDRLSPGPRRTLEPAAVCGRTFWLSVLERVEPSPTLLDDLATLQAELVIAERAVAPDAVYAFRHTLIQEVAYATQLQTRRRSVHGAVAAALEAVYVDRLDEVVDLLAYHYARSDNSAKAGYYLVRAGDRARRLFANDEAARSYARASELPDVEQPVRRQAFEGLGDAQAPLGNLDASRTAYAHALDLTEHPQDHARLQRKLAMVDVRAGDYASATSWLDRAASTVGDTSDAEIAAIWLDRTQVAWRQGRYDEAITAGQRAASLAEQAHWLGGMAEAFKHLGTALVLKGERSAGVEQYGRALTVYRQLDDLPGLMNVHNNLGIVYRRQARWAEALEEQQHALELARRVSDAWSVGMVLANIGETLRSQGALEAALQTNVEALRVWTRANYAVGVATVTMNIGLVNLEYGRLPEARQALQRALEQWQQLDSRLFLPELYRALAQVELESNPDLSIDWAHRSLEVARDTSATDEEGAALRVLARVHAARGERDQARARYAEAIDVLRRTSSQVELARALQGLAQTLLASADGDRRRVQALASEAADLFAQAGALAEQGEAAALASASAEWMK